MGRNASNLKPLAPLEDTQPPFLDPFRSPAESTENSSPSAVTALEHPWGCGDPVLVALSLPGAGATWALEPRSCCPGCPGWVRGVFMQIHKHPAQLEMRFAVRTGFPSAVWVLCFSLNRGLDRSLLSSSEFHTCTLLILVWILVFFFSLLFLIIKLLLRS